jgi:predicted site-specific integrase-resolvase
MKKIEETDIAEIIKDKTRLVNEKLAAQILGLSYQTLKRTIRPSGRIPYYRMTHKITYRIADLENYIKRCKIPAVN